MTEKKLPKTGERHGSILRSLVQIFAVFIAISIAFSLVISSFVSYAEIKEESFTHSHEAADSVESILEDRRKMDIGNDQALPIRYTLMFFCRGYDLRYLYLFTLDEENSEYHYLVIVSQDANETDVLMETRGLGAVVKADDIPQGVLDANKGSRDPHIVNYDNELGKVIGWVYPMDIEYEGRRVLIGAEYSLDVLYKRMWRRALMLTIPITLILIAVSVFLLLITHRRIIAPIAEISKRMRSFSDDYGKDEHRLDVTQNNEIGEIASSFNKMSDDIHSLIADNTALNEVKLQTQIQLDIARRIQSGIVPENMSRGGSGFSVCGFARPAKSVGGDFYDSFALDGSRVCIVIGDVSGKGITAALFMTMTKTTIREMLKSGKSPAESLNTANDDMCASNPEGMFATVFAAVLDLSTGELTYANAGHNPPVVIGEKARFLSVKAGIALGVFEDAGIEDQTASLKSGETILLYTDGVTEAVNKDDKFFGDERLLSACEGCSGADGAVEAVRGAVLDFYAGRVQFDDLTLIALEYSGGGTELALKPELSETQRLLGAVKETAAGSPRLKKICLACDEVFANICSYSGAKSVLFSCRRSDGLTITFTDDGTPFDPLAPQEEKDFDDLDTGGMGLSLVKQSADEVTYSREDGKNVLTLRFETI